MRILHTSDWHLGRSFHRVGLLDAQAAYLDHLLEVVESEAVDVVVVSGDIYDRALPPVDAVELASSTFARFAASRATLVVSSGNHDSAIRLGYNAELAEVAGVHIRTKTFDVARPVLLEDRHGPVAIYPLPYLEPDGVASAWQLSERSHSAALGSALAQVQSDLQTRQQTQSSRVRSVVMAHAFVANAGQRKEELASESERDISVGGLELVPRSHFDAFDYAALGHLHGARALSESVRYSGSPLAFSFSEAGHRKGSWLVDLDANGVTSAEFIPAPVPKRLGRLRGQLDALLVDPSLQEWEGAWLEVTLTDALRPAAAMQRLQGRFAHALLLNFDPVGGEVSRPRLPQPSLSGRNDLDIALGFVSEVRALEATSEEELLLQLACDSCHGLMDRDADKHAAGVG